MRTILSNSATWTPQLPFEGHIGVIPNLRLILENLSKK